MKNSYFSSIDHYAMTSGKWEVDLGPSFSSQVENFHLALLPKSITRQVNRLRRHLTSDPCCKYCTGNLKTMTRLFRDYPKASDVWKATGGPSTMQRTFSLYWDAWQLGLLLTFTKELQIL